MAAAVQDAIPEPASAPPAAQSGRQSWREANLRLLLGECERLRLLLRRRVLWLRQRWSAEGAAGYQGLAVSDGRADALLRAGGGDPRRFYREDREAAAVTAALARLEADLGRERQALEAAGWWTALDALAARLRLGAFERDLVLLCLAPELEPSFGELYAYAEDDVTRKFPTFNLAAALLAPGAEERLAARETLTPGSALLRWQVLILEPGTNPALPQGAWPLRLAPRVVSYLLGAAHVEERVATLARPLPPAPLTPELERRAAELETWLRNRLGEGPWPAVSLVGPPGSGKRALAQAVAERLGLTTHRVAWSRLKALGAELSPTLHLLEREALLTRLAVYLEVDPADLGPDAALLEEALERLDMPLFVGSRERLTVGRSLFVVALDKAGAAGERVLWQRSLGAAAEGLDGAVERLVEQFDLGPTGIAQAIRTAREQARFDSAGKDESLTAAGLWRACRAEAGRNLDDLAQRIVARHGWEDIVLPADVLAQLHEVSAQVGQRYRVYEEWGFGAKLARGRGLSALFNGPSGTGKTLAAEILARHLDLDLFRIDLSGVVSKYIGETEKNLRRVFDAAEASGAILFFDEADALFGKRSEVKDSHDRYANIEVNYLLQRMEDYRGLAILATNMKSHLDQAFLRRLRFLVEFPLPDAVHREKIWRTVFPSGVPLDGLDYAALSRLDVPGGNIKNIAVNAAFLASQAGTPVGPRHIAQAARREYAKIERLPFAAEFAALDAGGRPS